MCAPPPPRRCGRWSLSCSVQGLSWCPSPGCCSAPVDITGLSFSNNPLGLVFIQPVAYLGLLFLQVFIHLEEMGDLLEQVRRDVVQALHPVPLGIAHGHAEDLLIRA